MRRSVLSALVFAAAIGAAQAQTAFDGGYFGLGVGYGFGEATNFDATGSLSVDGFAASSVVGWNFSSGNFVFGPEAEFTFGSITGSDSCVNPSWTCEARIGALASLRGRVGFAGDNWLGYVTAGAAAGQVELTTINNVGTEFPDSQWATGWVAGVGVEGMMANSPWRYRVEYLYHDLGEQTYQTDVPYTSAVTVGVARAMMVMNF